MKEKNKKYKLPLRIRLRIWWEKVNKKRIEVAQKEDLSRSMRFRTKLRSAQGGFEADRNKRNYGKKS